MYDVVIWGTGHGYSSYIDQIKFQEAQGEIRVKGISSFVEGISRMDGYVFIKAEWLVNIDFDYVIITDNTFPQELCNYFNTRMGDGKERCIFAEVFRLPAFSFSRYIKVIDSNISIIASFCWGGFCYNHLRMQFRSPFINLFMSDRDFNAMMLNFKEYMSLPMEYDGEGYEVNQKRNYPIGRIGELKLNLNHYKDFEEANDAWERRKKRINYDNLLIVSGTKDEAVAEEFDRLPFENKIIFVPFKGDRESYMQMPRDILNANNIGMQANMTALGAGIDVLKLLNHEKDFVRFVHTGQNVYPDEPA